MVVYTEIEVRQDVAGALARAYTVPVNSGKEVDVDLVEAMITEMVKLLREKPALSLYYHAPVGSTSPY